MITLLVADQPYHVEQTKSRLLNSLLDDLHQTSVTVEVPEKLWPIINNYLDFLTLPTASTTSTTSTASTISTASTASTISTISTASTIPFGATGERKTISDVSQLIDCFKVENFYEDSDYFLYLVQQLADGWSQLSVALDTITDPNTVRDIYLHLPFTLAPQRLKLDPNFTKDWLLQTRRVTDNFNGQTYYHTRTTYASAGETGDKVTKLIIETITTNSNYDSCNVYEFYSGLILVCEKMLHSVHSRFKTEIGAIDNGVIRHWSATKRVLLCEMTYVDGQTQATLNFYSNGRVSSHIRRLSKTGKERQLITYFSRRSGALTDIGVYSNLEYVGDWYRYDPQTACYNRCTYQWSPTLGNVVKSQTPVDSSNQEILDFLTLHSVFDVHLIQSTS